MRINQRVIWAKFTSGIQISSTISCTNRQLPVWLALLRVSGMVLVVIDEGGGLRMMGEDFWWLCRAASSDKRVDY